MDDKESLQTLTYTIKLEEYEQAFISFQKKYVYPKNILMTAAFAVIIVLYIQSVYTDPTYTIAWVLIGVCAALIALIWYNAYKIRKTLIKSIKDIKDDKYTTNIYDDSIVIKTEIVQTDENEEIMEIEPKTISFSYDNPEIMENNNMFIVYLKKQMFYVIPKNDLTEEQVLSLRNIFEEKLEKRFIKLKK